MANTDPLSTLNPAQKRAVLHARGPLLIIAGAGAGKTRTLTMRILNLIRSGVAPEEILAITFTNKAAGEMRERITTLIKEDCALNLPVHTQSLPFTSTFHALGVYILRNHGHVVDVPRRFSIADDSDSISLIKECLKELSLDPKQFQPRRIRNVISRQKGDGKTLAVYQQEAGNQYFPRIVAHVWEQYDKKLKENKSVDFDDLLLKTVQVLKRDEEARTHYQNKWHYIHIDEYQDTNTVQYELSKLLAGERKNICVVGDMDQSIYSWRGADFRNIMRFEEDYPHAEIVLLEENYRSTQTIITAANDIIKKNAERKEKNLFTRKGEGERITLFSAFDAEDEARFVANKVHDLLRKGCAPKDIAILYRANFQSRVLEEALIAAEIPYQVLGVKFFERKEIKDMLSFAQAALDPTRFADINRIINVPPRGIGKATIAKIFSGQRDLLTPAFCKKVDNFFAILSDIQKELQTKKVSAALTFILQRSGLRAHLEKGTEEDKERLENIKELVTLATKYDALSPEEGIEKLLEDAALASDQDSLTTQKKEERDAVRLMTVHASKGLEFPFVFITGLEHGLFPHDNLDVSRDDTSQQEEERRLFYVALTRAEKKLFLSYAQTRIIFGMKQINVPSEFILDIPENLVETHEDLLPSIE